MGLIYIGSTDLLSSSNTSRFIVPILRWIKPDISWSTIRTVHHYIRKAGHVTEYAVLAILIYRAIPKPDSAKPFWRRWLPAAITLGGAALFAASDEFHQSFYRSRGPSAGDVLIDSIGALVGLSLIYLFHRWRHRPPAPQ